jgi:nitroreductase
MDFDSAMNFRHACKLFDETKEIKDEDFQKILEWGRLSPSSFGLEEFRFLIVEDKKKKQELRAACWDQWQLTTAPKVVALKALTKDLLPGSDYVKTMLQRKAKDENSLKAYLQRYAGFMEDKSDPESLKHWSEKQAYIASANMMTGAASLGIDSCPIEGFVRSEVEKVLEIDKEKESLALIVAFGYRAKEQSKRVRLPLERYVETM